MEAADEEVEAFRRWWKYSSRVGEDPENTGENIVDELPIEEVEAVREHLNNKVMEDLRNEGVEAASEQILENIVEDLTNEEVEAVSKTVSEHLKNVVEDLRNEGEEAASENLKKILEDVRNEDVETVLSLAEAKLRQTITGTESDIDVDRVIKSITEEFTRTSAYQMETISGHAEAPLPNVPLAETVDSVLEYHDHDRWEFNQLVKSENQDEGSLAALSTLPRGPTTYPFIEKAGSEEVLKKLRYDSVASAEDFTELLQQARVEADAAIADRTQQSSEELFDENPNSSSAHLASK